MSETAKIRSELKKSLVQHLFHYFEELKKTNSESVARSIVTEEVNDLRDMFSEEEASVSFLSSLEEEISYWTLVGKKARASKDLDRAYQSEEVLSSIKVLKFATKGEFELNGKK